MPCPLVQYGAVLPRGPSRDFGVVPVQHLCNFVVRLWVFLLQTPQLCWQLHRLPAFHLISEAQPLADEGGQRGGVCRDLHTQALQLELLKGLSQQIDAYPNLVLQALVEKDEVRLGVSPGLDLY